jgi:hypothetical protein
VQHQYRVGVDWPVFYPGHPKLPALTIVDFAIPWAVREFGQIREVFVGRAQCLHAGEHTVWQIVQ